MNFLTATKNIIVDFAREEEGAQVVEYALIIALVSIALAIGLATIAGSAPFDALKTRITNCLSGSANCTA